MNYGEYIALMCYVPGVDLGERSEASSSPQKNKARAGNLPRERCRNQEVRRSMGHHTH